MNNNPNIRQYQYVSKRDILAFTEPFAALSVNVSGAGVPIDTDGKYRIYAGQALQAPDDVFSNRNTVCKLVTGAPDTGNTVIGVTQHDIVFNSPAQMANANCIVFGYVDPNKMDVKVTAIPDAVRESLAGKVTFVVGDNGYAVDVYDYETLRLAATSSNVTAINLMSDIDLLDTITINHPLTFNGNGYAVSYSEDEFKDGLVVAADNVHVINLTVEMFNDDPAWEGHYGLQVYNATGVILEDVLCTGEDGGILINGSSVETRGFIDVSRNAFGGIEVSKGSTTPNDSELTVTGTTFRNATEAYGSPTIWIDGGGGTVVGGSQFTVATVEGQEHYYLVPWNSVPDPNSKLQTLSFTNGNIGLQPAFDPDVYEYTGMAVRVGTTLTAEAQTPGATVTAWLNGIRVPVPGALVLSSGINRVRVACVLGTDTTMYDVTIAVTPGSALLSILNVSDVVLTPPFSSGTFSYTGDATVDTFTVTATPESPTAVTLISLNGVVITSGGTWQAGSNTLLVEVTNGDASETYTVSVEYTP